MQSVIIITVHRRYYELTHNLRVIRSQFSDFRIKPVVVLVWACPEPSMQWLFDSLIRNGEADHIIYRDELPNEHPNQGTTYPESYNIRIGLDFAAKINPGGYAIVQASDIEPSGAIYKLIDKEIVSHQMFVFHWLNNLVRGGIYHTNFFAVKLDDTSYWPPISTYDHSDILERQWSLELLDKGKTNILVWSNAIGKYFQQSHISENLDEQTKNLFRTDGVGLFIAGKERLLQGWKRRIKEFLNWKNNWRYHD